MAEIEAIKWVWSLEDLRFLIQHRSYLGPDNQQCSAERLAQLRRIHAKL